MNNKGINKNLNGICSILNKLERLGCEYSFQFMSTSGIVISRSYLSKEGVIDTFECNTLINKIRDIVDLIPIKSINNLLLQFPHNKIQKIIGFKQINNDNKIKEEVVGKMNNVYKSQLPTQLFHPRSMAFNGDFVPNILNRQENVDYNNIDLLELNDGVSIDLNGFTFEQKQVIVEMEERFDNIINNLSDNIEESMSHEEILKMANPNEIGATISEFFQKFQENDIPLNIMTGLLRKRGIIMNFNS